jgi:uncharacterized membrane protein
MQNTVSPLLIAHAGAGSVMLLTGLPAMTTRKGQYYHRLWGKVYAGATAVVGLTGFAIAVIKSNQFLIATSIFVLYMMVSAYRSLYLKKLHLHVRAAPIDKAIFTGAAIGALYLLLLGIRGLLAGHSSGIVPLLFGGLCAGFTLRDIKKYTKGPNDKLHWLFNHISGMVGSYIAGITAFLAVNAGYFTNDFVLWVWLGPTVVGTPYIIYNIRRYRNKKGAIKELRQQIAVVTTNDE